MSLGKYVGGAFKATFEANHSMPSIKAIYLKKERQEVVK